LTGEADLSENRMIGLKGPDGFHVPLSELWLAARVGAWLCCLPVALRVHTLPSLLEKVSLEQGRPDKRRRLEPARIAEIVGRVCRMRLFDLPIFPRACLRRALALYSVFTRNAYPIEICIGVRKDGGDLHAHSWVALEGKPLRERDPELDFRTIYSYPAAAKRSPFGKGEMPVRVT